MREEEEERIEAQGNIRMENKNSSVKGKSESLGKYRCGSEAFLVKNAIVKVRLNECVDVGLGM